ncbi:MAG: GNAT family N-acetyltransferase [Chloroflexi bacterium]|nr:GNAT family N-acetyltransferase [Chloroflexota bacterium]MCL5108205.1 GNAT family N-acetyltransferase [Chloroflexota bacterium]
MFGRFRAASQPQNEPLIVPLSEHEFARLARRDWSFPYADIVSTINANPELAFRAEGTAECVVGGHWRRRHDIGSVEYLRAGSAASRLVHRLEQVLRTGGARLLVLGGAEQSGNLGLYQSLGFQVVDEIVRYQRSTARAPQPQHVFPLRSALPEDLAGLLAVDHAAFPWLWWNSEEELAWYLALPGVEAHVALDGPSVVGYTGFTITGQQGHLDRLAVHPDYQGRGLGSDLVLYTLARMQQRRVDRVALTTQVDNFRSAGLYRSLGFIRTAVRYPLYGLWLAEVPDRPAPI